MRKISSRAPIYNCAQPPLLALMERCRWNTAPLAARMVRRRCGIQSAATATGSAKRHAKEQADLINQALSLK